MENSILGAVEKLAEYTVEPVWRQFKYVIHYESNIENVSNEVKRLGHKRKRIELDVEAARNNLEPIDAAVETWLEDADKMIEENQRCFRKEALALNASFFGGRLPNLKFRHSMGRKAYKMSLDVDKLLRDQENFTTVANPAPPPRLPVPSRQPYEDFIRDINLPRDEASSSGTSIPPGPPSAEALEYRLPHTKEVLTALQDESIKMIGICGVIRGRDTVAAKEFIKNVKHDLFEEVVMTVVSQNPDLERIQSEIADKLGLELRNRSFPERAEMLRTEISSRSKKFLLILADVWKILDLEAIGIPHVGRDQKCKIMLTSPDERVFTGITERSLKLILEPSSTGMGTAIDLESRNAFIREVVDALKDNQINLTVICGMSGIGKSILAGQIGRKAEAERLFDVVATATVNKEPNLIRIQGEIAGSLGLRFNLEKDHVSGRACKLHERLTTTTQRILIILDNVWATEPNFWEEVGIPIPFHQSCKILVTSQNQDLSIPKMKTRNTFCVELLQETEAWTLFKEMTNSSSIESDIRLLPIAKEVVRECGGLPLAISVVGRALEHGNEDAWRNALRQLTKACPENIPELTKKVYQQIELSYQLLESKEAKSCLLLCCLFSESGNIVVEDLIRYAFGLGLFKGIDSLSEERTCVQDLVTKLKRQFLLLDSKKEGCVRMHDMVHQVGLSLASKSKDQFLIRHGVELKDWPTKKKGFLRQPYTSSTLTTTKTELLVLSCTDCDPLSTPPGTFLEELEDLKVLDMRRTRTLPSLALLKGLNTLRLEHCNLESVSVIGGLQTLEILSLRGSVIIQFPSEIGNLSGLRLLDLTECKSPEESSPGVLSKLENLEELYLRNSFLQWLERFSLDGQSLGVGVSFRPGRVDVETNAELSELLSWSRLTSLESVLPPSDNVENSKVFDKLERFKISIGMMSLPAWHVNSCGNYLGLYGLKANSLAGSRISGLLKNTNILELAHIHLGDPVNVLDGECCKKLKSLTVNYCRDLEYLIDTTRMVPSSSAFPVLGSLKIVVGDRLKEICHGELPKGSFEELRELCLSNLPALTHLWDKLQTDVECLGNLGHVKVHSCAALKFLFMFPVGMHLKQLEELEIQNCKDMEEILAAPNIYEIKFPNLTHLNLQDLPSLVGISKNIYKMDFPLLMTLKLEGLPQLISLYPNSFASESSSNAAIQHLFDYSKAKSFRQLRFVKVISCEKLSGVFSSNVVLQSLHNLEEIEVRNCSLLETVFDIEGPEINATVALSCLEIMELNDLPMLTHVWKPPQSISAFQNLRKLQVLRCQRLRYVFQLFIAEGLVKLELLNISDCHGMEDIVAKNAGGGDGEVKKNIVFSQVNTLYLVDLGALRTFCAAPNCTLNWPSLKKLVLVGCLYMKTFVASGGAGPAHLFGEKVDFPVLETLKISEMNKIDKMWNSPLSLNAFCELRELDVTDCTNLLVLVSTYMQNRLQNLTTVAVRRCCRLRQIFEGHAVTISESGEAPSISQLVMQTRGLQNLTTLLIHECNSLRYLFSPSVARCLVKLRKLEISNCAQMEEVIIKSADGEETENNSMLPQLSHLDLCVLEDLTSFSQGSYSFEWPLVEKIQIYRCFKMRNFCSGPLSIAREVEISDIWVDPNVLQEFNNSRK